MLGCKQFDTLMDLNKKFKVEDGERLIDIGRYRRLVGTINWTGVGWAEVSLNYFTCARTGPVLKQWTSG